LKFINLTRRTEIGANSYYLEIADRRLVLDCGMHPKNEGDDALPNFKAIADRPLDAILISHSHQDHIGTLPVLMRRQPNARVFMPEATADIGAFVMEELKKLDKVAYVRFASVYRHFRDIGEFMTELKDLLNAKE